MKRGVKEVDLEAWSLSRERQREGKLQEIDLADQGNEPGVPAEGQYFEEAC